jgi:hypothetical protein
MGLVADSAQGNPASKRCSWPAKSKLESSTVRRVSTASGPQSSASPCPVCACCLVRRQTRVRTRVKVCLHTPPFAAARCNLSPCDLQPVSAWRNSSRVVWPDFNPKAAGSIPARPSRFAGKLCGKHRPVRTPRSTSSPQVPGERSKSLPRPSDSQGHCGGKRPPRSLGAQYEFVIGQCGSEARCRFTQAFLMSPKGLTAS